MPVTKTAKRALRSSKNKEKINKSTIGKLEIAVRSAVKSKNPEKIRRASSMADKAAKKKVIHKNKAARIKSQLSKLLSGKKSESRTPVIKKTKSSKKASEK